MSRCVLCRALLVCALLMRESWAAEADDSGSKWRPRSQGEHAKTPKTKSPAREMLTAFPSTSKRVDVEGIIWAEVQSKSISVEDEGGTAVEFPSLSGKLKGGRALQQTNRREARQQDFECSLSRRQRDTYLIANERTWLVDDAVLHEVENDLQTIVNCTHEGDGILFNVTKSVRPSTRVVIPWSLVLGTYEEDGGLMDGIFVETTSKTMMRCPRRNEGAFLVRDADDLLFSNLEFRRCDLASNTQTSAIIEIEECRSGRVRKRLRFQHVSFKRNTLLRATSVRFRSPSCWKTVWVSVKFLENNCSGICGAILPARSSLSDVIVNKNEGLKGGNGVPVLLSAPPGSRINVDNLTAVQNNATILSVANSSLTLSNSNFTANFADLSPRDDPPSASVVLVNSSAVIERSVFKRNRGGFGSVLFTENSNVTVVDSSFTGNRAVWGGVMRVNRNSSVSTVNCTFSSNEASDNCGVAYATESEISCSDSKFANNSAVNHGGCFCLLTVAKLHVLSSEARQNKAEDGGYAIFRTASFGLVKNSTFNGNVAEKTAGSFYLDASHLDVEDCQFNDGYANSGGSFFMEASSMNISNSSLVRSSANVGGGIYAMEESRFVMNWVSIEASNVTVYGGAIYLDGLSSANISNAELLSNHATDQGGAVSADGSQLITRNTTVSGNSADYGGGIRCVNGTEYEATNCTFTKNSASYGGAVLLLEKVSANMSDCIFQNNEAEVSGGHVFCQESRANISDCHFEEGLAEYGGFLFMYEAEVTVRRSDFANAAASYGGCLYSREESALSLDDVNVTSCEAEEGGGAMRSENSTLVVENSVVSNSNAGGGGGGIVAVDGGTLSIAHSFFFTNSAELGGAIALDRSLTSHVAGCEFYQNSAETSGGDLYISESNVSIDQCHFAESKAEYGGSCDTEDGSDVTVSNSIFRSAKAKEGGGCLVLYEETTSQIQNVTFENCSSLKDGGAVYLEDRATATLINCCFLSNKANHSGGAVFALESDVLGVALTFHSNSAGDNGGAVYSEDSNSVNITDSSIVGNKARYGGAVFLLAVKDTIFDMTRFMRNNADKRGGAIYIQNSVLLFERGQLSDSDAGYGGFFFSNNATMSISNSTFKGGSATDSGGILLITGKSTATFRDVVVLDGRANLGGGVALRRSSLIADRIRISGCRADEGGALFGELSSTLLCAECLYENNVATERGGAVSFLSRRSRSLSLQLENTTFFNNKAEYGGGLHLVTRKSVSDCTNPRTFCIHAALAEAIFVGNRADQAGGALFIDNPEAIRVNCSARNSHTRTQFYNRQELESMEEIEAPDKTCSTWKGNEAGVYGNALGSYAQSVTKTIVDTKLNRSEMVIGNQYTIQGHSSGSSLPVILLEVVDAFGQGPAIGVNNDTVVATMTSPDGFFNGSLIVNLTGGSGSFTGVSSFQPSGNYKVQIEFSEALIQTFVIEVHVRSCKIGETLVAKAYFCQSCDSDSYNFWPDSATECLRCPENGICVNSFIQPSTGHWHKHPCSEHIQRCLTMEACDFKARREDLIAVVDDGLSDCEFDETFIAEYSKIQCGEGYRGPLCGSCESSYGKSQFFVCQKCFSGFTNFMLVILSILVLFGISGVTIRSNLISLLRHGGNVDPIPPPSAGPSVSSAVAANERMLEMMSIGHLPPEATMPSKPEKCTEQQIFEQEELWKWKATELFKITINNLQVTAVAIAINVEWHQTLVGMFDAAEFLSGVTSEAAGRSVDCLVSDDSSTPRSIVSSVIDLLFPVIVIFMYLVLWTAVRLNRGESLVYLMKKSILSAVAVLYISYISLTKTLVNILNCVDVHDRTELLDDGKTSYWVVDTTVKCYDGSHALLTGIVGWPFLILFSFGFPVVLACVITKKVGEDFKSGWIYETAGFMYRAYKPRFVFWESIIMLRKALLAVVLVFAYPLGGNLQGILGVFVLALALYFQTLCRPYRPEFDVLNEIEGVSLLVSLITFVSSLFFNDDNVSSEIRTFVTVAVVLCNAVLFLFLVSLLMCLMADYLKFVLQSEGVEYDPNGGRIHILRIYSRHVFLTFVSYIGRAVRH